VQNEFLNWHWFQINAFLLLFCRKQQFSSVSCTSVIAKLKFVCYALSFIYVNIKLITVMDTEFALSFVEQNE